MKRICVRLFEPVEKEHRLQKHFKLFRMASGHNVSGFAGEIGVTRQLVNAIEAGKCNVTYLTYLGVEGLVINSNSEFLKEMWDILVDNNYTPDLESFACHWGNIIAGAINSKVITLADADGAWRSLQ